MADSDDLKDHPDKDLGPGASEKQPLGFEQEQAPPDPGRRLVLKLALMGAAAALAPNAANAFAITGEGTAGEPVDRPYSNRLVLEDTPGILSDGVSEGNYLVSGQGDLYIDAAGVAFLSNIQLTGKYVSGALNNGTISIVQPTPSRAGMYKDTQLAASTTVLYSDNTAKQQPSSFQVHGELAKGSSRLSAEVGVSVGSSGIEWEIRVSWTKSC
jgi:hypothetical protein